MQSVDVDEKPTPVAKLGYGKSRVLLCVLLNSSGILYYLLLERGETVNANVYCKLLKNLNKAIFDKGASLANINGVLL